MTDAQLPVESDGTTSVGQETPPELRDEATMSDLGVPTSDQLTVPVQNQSTPEASPATQTTGVPALDVTTLSPVFKLVFLSVLGITVLTFAANVVLVLMIKEPSDSAKSLLDTCSTITKMGFAAVVGLIGGKLA